jgi:hypothetical protein
MKNPSSLVLAFVVFLGSVSSGCDGGSGGADAGADGGSDSGGGNLDSGPRDAGPRPTDSGADASQHDAGPGCTSGCNWVELALGAEFSCARRENGEVRCWGRAQDGELGDGLMRHRPGCPVGGAADADCSARPVRVALPADEPARALSAVGGVSACAIDDEGDVWCWGAESFRIGGNPETNRYAPELFPGLSRIRQVSDSFLHICAVQTDGAPLCAGHSRAGQTGTGMRDPVLLPMPVLRRNPDDPSGMSPPVPLTGVMEIRTSTAFSGFSCARTASELLCWGSDESGQLGTGDEIHGECVLGMTRANCSDIAVPLSGIDAGRVRQLSLGQSHACALLDDGTLLCWGGNEAGQLGTGDTMQRSAPTRVPGISGVRQVAAGASHTCVLLTDGSVRCWGLNRVGQLGDGETDHGTRCRLGADIADCSLTPVQVAVIDDGQFLATGRNHSCVIRATNEVWCWGENDKLQLGDGPERMPEATDRAPRFMPVRVIGL